MPALHGVPWDREDDRAPPLRSRLASQKSVPLHAVLIDFEQYLNPYATISITDVLRVLAYALDREATRAEGGDPNQSPGYVRRLFDFLARTDVELQKVASPSTAHP